MNWKGIVEKALVERKVWQVAAGDNKRNYVEICLDWEVILNGPSESEGKPRDWRQNRKILQQEISSQKFADLRRFCDEIADGDIVVLRLGTGKVYGVGQVVGGYDWCDAFCDIDGWYIGHIRRVRWLMKQPPFGFFGAHAMKMGTTKRLDPKSQVAKWLRNLAVSQGNITDDLRMLPDCKPLPDTDELWTATFDHLLDQGVASDSIKTLVSEIKEFVRIGQYYQQADVKPSKDETRAYLVIPLLRALGWTPQKMAVEWSIKRSNQNRRMDIALFGAMPRKDEHISTVVEVKKLGDACLPAVTQVRDCVAGLAACKRIIVTDGHRYGVFVKSSSGEFALHAYLNLTRPRHKYPVYECEGAKDALFAMTPEWTDS